MKRVLVGLVLPAFLLGCDSTAESVWATDEEVARSSYTHDGPASITLYTVIRTATGSGLHAALLINGSERVVFDPAGSWWHPQIPERNDVHFGMTPHVVDFYIDYHTREESHTVSQTVYVSPEVAEMALEAVLAYGAVPKTQCTRSITTVLSELPGFEDIPISWFPPQAMEYFESYPGVETQVYYDTPDDIVN